jgi:hypothetical protein
MPPAARNPLLEAAVTAHRPADPAGELRFHPAFHDLDAAGRAELFRVTSVQRALEQAAAGDGLSTTALAVLRRIRGAAR